MSKHTLNMFRIANSSELDFSYKLVETTLPRMGGQEKLYKKQTTQVVRKVASLSKGPAVPVCRGNKLFIAIPADNHLEDCKVDISPLVVSLTLRREVYNIPKGQLSTDDKAIALRFLDFEIKRQLHHNNLLWQMHTETFFQKRALQQDADSSIEIFGGFKYKLLHEKNSFYISLDITFKYIAKQSLSELIQGTSLQLAENNYRKRKFLYQSGNDWYTVELVGLSGKIGEHEFSRDNVQHNLYEYIAERNALVPQESRCRVSPNDVALFYKYPGRVMEPHMGATSLARLIYQTSDREATALHRASIKAPEKRFGTISHVIRRFFQDLKFNRRALSVSVNPETEDAKSFPLPQLLFNNGRKLTVSERRADGYAALSDFGSERQQHIVDNGIINTSNFDAQYLIVPEGFDQRFVNAFQREAESYLKGIAPLFTKFQVIRYKADARKSATEQAKEISMKLAAQNVTNGCALIVLPDDLRMPRHKMARLHDCMKCKFHHLIRVQCLSGAKLKSYFKVWQNAQGGRDYRVPEQLRTKFRSYLRNLVFEYLIVNRKWAYALANNLHYDVYVGIDVHGRFAGFTFFFKNGQQIVFASERVMKRNSSQRAEKLSDDLLYKTLYEKLKKYIPKYANMPNGIVIIRDGRSFGEEEKALQRVVASLNNDGIVNSAEIKTGVIDLHKQSAIPLRLVSRTNGHTGLENPAAGTYKLLGHNEGFLFNTGFPFKIRGTAKPLHFALRTGDVVFTKVLEDLFHQSMLAFSAPELGSALPVTIKLIDTLLEPLAAMYDFDNASADVEDEEEDQEIIVDYQ